MKLFLMALRLPGIQLDQTRRSPKSLAGQVTVPTLVLHCEDDGLVPLGHGQHTQASIAGSSMVTYPSGGTSSPGGLRPPERRSGPFWPAVTYGPGPGIVFGSGGTCGRNGRSGSKA